MPNRTAPSCLFVISQTRAQSKFVSANHEKRRVKTPLKLQMTKFTPLVRARERVGLVRNVADHELEEQRMFVAKMPDYSIAIKLFGSFEATRSDGKRLTIRSQRAKLIVACLADVNGDTWTRDRLAEMIWEGRGIEQRRSSLRQELVRLRKDLGLNESATWTDGKILRLPPQINVDMIAFENAVHEGEVQTALTVYRGDLLQDVKLTSNAINEWVSKNGPYIAITRLLAVFNGWRRPTQSMMKRNQSRNVWSLWTRSPRSGNSG